MILLVCMIVNELTPADIKVMGAMGDSITVSSVTNFDTYSSYTIVHLSPPSTPPPPPPLSLVSSPDLSIHTHITSIHTIYRQQWVQRPIQSSQRSLNTEESHGGTCNCGECVR
jgi:hypothetical protein